MLKKIFKGEHITDIGIGVPISSVPLGGDLDPEEREARRYEYINLYFTVGMDVYERQYFIMHVHKRWWVESVSHYKLRDNQKCKFCGDNTSYCSYLSQYKEVLVGELKKIIEQRLSFLDKLKES